MWIVIANTIFFNPGVGSGPTPPPPLIWNTASNRWESETETWN